MRKTERGLILLRREAQWDEAVSFTAFVRKTGAGS